tara:strand:+ start:1787 stop:2809 length:1023 start_codon:yes stop_codon:yes gene_type:complete
LKRSTAFFINGGAGRVICSLPAFELYEKENPDDDFIIVCEGGMDFYKGHPTLHNRAYDHWHKGLFEEHIKDRNCISPEPYRVWEYYNQKCDLAQAFDIAINNKGLREVSDPKIYANKQEIVQAATIIEEIKQGTGKDKVLVVQPFGRSTESHSDFIIDSTSRSFQLNNIVDIINILKKEYAIIVMSEIPVPLEEKENTQYPVAQPQIPDLRIWSSIIDIADHFLGCDSLGQHMAKALGGSATIITGSTYPVNISYPDDPKFDIIDIGEGKRVYAPIRLTMEEEQDRHNDEVMELNEKQIETICESVRKVLGKAKITKQSEAKKQISKLVPGSSTLTGDKK